MWHKNDGRMDMVYLWVHSYSFNTYLLSTCCLPGAVVDSERFRGWDEQDRDGSYIQDIHKLAGETDNKQTNKQTKKHMI